MSKELIVSTGRHETRVAILEDDQIVELFHEREKEYSLAGSIHKGRVTRVLPGMQSAFVDIGLERDAFLYVSDFFEDNEEYDAVVSGVEEKVLKMEKGERVSEPALVADYSLAATSESAVSPAIVTTVATPAGLPEARQEPQRENRGHDRGGGGPRTGDRPVTAAQDASGDRRGGGRRGRRRRGGRGPTGIPDSKFYSPKDDENKEQESFAEPTEMVDMPGERRQATAPAAPQASFTAPAHTAPSYTAPSYTLPASLGDDFMVLPGESLAKYSPTDTPDAEEDAEESVSEHVVAAESVAPKSHGADAVVSGLVDEPAAEAPAIVHEPAIAEPPAQTIEATVHAPESALPFEHPLSGLGVVPVWNSEAVPETAPHSMSETSGAVEEAVKEETEQQGAVQQEVAQQEAVQHDAVQEETARPESEIAETETDEDAALELEGESLETTAEIGEGEISEAEGPEPARIPTSLTATLREQGHRYPHRVSRRMRRKMRGGQPGEGQPAEGPAGKNGEPKQGDRQPRQGPAEAAAPVETRTPDVREERPERQGRGDRRPDQRGEGRPERGGERSGERGRDRGDRGERPERERTALPSISDLLKEGQEIIVQIAKEPLGQKGARITSHIALPGRFVVYMPTVDHVGVSRKIPSDEERQRLKKILQTHRQGIPGGFICRTAGDGKTEEELKSDMHFLYNLWLDMRQKAEKKPAPLLLHHDLDLVERVLRDQLTSSFKTIWVDNEEYYESILRFVQRFQPALVGRVKLYTRSTPIFDEFGVTNEVEKALRPKVWLKSGGYIVINQTEALVAIDINTGKYVGKSNRLEDTIVKINTDAIKEIVRQIRLRDLGGIIVVDFIDMDERKNRQKVMQSLEEAMRADRAPYKILQFNDFGLVAITRKRVKQSLERTLCAPCPYCEGAGYVKSVGTVIGEILQEAQRIQKSLDSDDVTLRVNPEVGKVLKSNQNTYLQEIEEILGRTVLVKSDPLLHQTKFDLA